ncbi:SusD/RagB family nutrient-binding outer membrane lipoprotein [Sphingobacterium sp. xlx-130]|uniref:SusD/RagB family nutrient-binding outer membrane lipoprotein n=1 Tax=Sphingobacterium sp. xlx-130 TaxID=2654323 RepID=UPI0013DBE7CD|nr:SusD/RagB family nutrient-binding outer membrane lipoprotein [Sphingobacterium sp. xlx-130]
MKTSKIYISGICAIALSLTLASCEKRLDDLFQNPESNTETKIEYLLPTAIDKTLRQDYSDIYTNHMPVISQLVQVLGSTTDHVTSNVYTWTNAADKGRWGDYYTGKMVDLKGMEQLYNYTLTDAQKEEYKPYYMMAKILMAYNTAKQTDLFDDMPYSEAFKAQNSLFGQPVVLYPKYDDQKSIYYAILADLKEAASSLAATTLQPTLYTSHAAFPQQDILFQGNLSKWVKFANSLRLRYAIRIAAKDDAKTKLEINDLLSTNAPLVTTNADNVYLYLGDQTAVAGGGGNTQTRAFNEQSNFSFAPKLMVDKMVAANDPRLPIFFKKPATNPIYEGMPAAEDAKATLGLNATTIPLRIARLDSTTFVRNTKLPTGVGITAADVDFLLAEAALKGYITGGDFAMAKSYYDEGIKRSIEAYYDIYIKSGAPTKVPSLAVQPTTAVKVALVNSSTYTLNPSTALEQIGIQKWMNTNILESYETYAEYRRLDFPVLHPDVQDGIQLNTADKLPVRLLYPASEIASNGTNFNAVAPKNNQNTKVWWDVN